MSTNDALYTGQTVKLTAADLTHIDDGAITSGAVVEFTITTQSGTVVVGPEVVTLPSTGDDWSVHVDLPDDPGSYVLKAAITVDDTIIGKERRPLYVNPF